MVEPLFIWVALFSPLTACGIITLFGLNSKSLSSSVAISGLLLSFMATVLAAVQIFSFHPAIGFQQSIDWLQCDGLSIPIGILVNPLAIMMLLVVTGVGSAIFIYARGYMAEDAGCPRFFAYLSLFAFSMIGIVLANNLMELFICWELVGLSSYLLIAFWHEKPSAADAGVKAFIVNRLADFGFLCGILLLWSLSDMGRGKSFEFTHLIWVIPHLNHPILEIAALLLFCGVMGKSAQLPFHVWLPDAMEGPTPVSALIHAATMVAAGVYLLARLFFIFAYCPQMLMVIAFIGASTSLMAATIAIVENDIKRILAYSTLSQLGLMVMALGLGGPMQGMYHLSTHAFFKALLFLGAGSVIHRLHHEQNIWNMKGLLRTMPITGSTFLIGLLALCGVFPLSGFWSKDEIMSLAHAHNPVLYVMSMAVSALTAFYMGRLFWVAFWGKPYAANNRHESPAVMTIPLIILAVFSMLGGFMNIPHWFYPQITQGPFNVTVALTSSLMAVLGLSVSYILYHNRPSIDPIEKNIKAFYVILKNKYYFDMVYTAYGNYVQQPAAVLLSKFEKIYIDRLCLGGLKDTTKTSSRLLRYAQNGIVQSYALVFVLGAVWLYWALIK